MRLIAHFLVLVIGTIMASTVAAENYPEKPIKIVVGYAPGGGADTFSRLLAKHLSEAVGQPVIVENRPGADARLATASVAQADPDGYTLLFSSTSHTINPAINKELPYDTVGDFAPVALVAEQQMVMVANPSKPFKTLPELLDYLRANPDKVNWGSSSTGTGLPAELFKLKTGTNFAHAFYKGTGPVIADTLAGHVDLTVAGSATALPHIKAGSLRALAVWGPTRMEQLPDVPTVGEFVPETQAILWSAVFAPAGTPRPIIDTLNGEIRKIVDMPEFAEAMSNHGATAVGSTPEELGQFVEREIKRWSDVVKDSGYKNE